MFKRACQIGIEGIVSKRADAPYSAGRSNSWTKVTCRKRDTFVVAGLAYNNRKFEGIYLARPEDMSYAGKVEHGFTPEAQRGGTSEARFAVFRCIERQRERLKRNLARVRRPQVWFDGWTGGQIWSIGLFNSKLDEAIARMRRPLDKDARAETSRRAVEIGGYRTRSDGLVYRP